MTKIRKTDTILLPLESYLYLQNKSYFERCGKYGSEKRIERLKKNFKEFSYNGYKQLCDGDLAGALEIMRTHTRNAGGLLGLAKI